MASTLLFKTLIYNLDTTVDAAGSDFVYNTVTSGAATALLANDVSVALKHFYQDVNTGQVLALMGYLAPSTDATRGVTWQAYDITTHLSGTPHGTPIASGAYALAAHSSSTQPMPEGVAGVISYRGNYGTDVEFIRTGSPPKVTARPRARHRGRIYLGPLASNAMAQDSTTKRTKLTPGFIADCQIALQKASQITDSGSNIWQLVHWSKKNSSIEPLIQQWMDDRPDYQRRRVDQSGTRTTAVYTYP